MGKVKQSIVLVTGASGNLGRAVINKFLIENYKVIGTVIPNESAKIKNRLYEELTVDLSNEKASQKLVDVVIEKYGKIDALIATVGGFAMGTVAKTSTADILKQYKLNFETAYNVVRPAFTQMLQQEQGRIFLIGSRPGLSAGAGKGMVAYGLAKSLIFRLAELLNDEAGELNIVSSVVVPSTIDTPLNRSSMPDADFEKWVKPEAIADVILFYCSKEAAALRQPVIKVYNNA